MQHTTHYDTVTKAIEELRKQGYTTDFNIEENNIVCSLGKFNKDNFKVADVYRYEGDSDPADEAAVYAIESSNGLKGILVSGYGVSADIASEEILEKLDR